MTSLLYVLAVGFGVAWLFVAVLKREVEKLRARLYAERQYARRLEVRTQLDAAELSIADRMIRELSERVGIAKPLWTRPEIEGPRDMALGLKRKELIIGGHKIQVDCWCAPTVDGMVLRHHGL